jgi:CHAD domain-containing protein
MREREAKLLVAPDFRLPALDGLDNGVQVASDESVELSAIYFDTPDLRLTRSGASLRHRSGEWTVKLPEPTEGSAVVRTELRIPGGASFPPPDAVDLIRAWIRTASLTEVARLETRRHRFILTDANGNKVAEVDDDVVTSAPRNGSGGRFREIEIELDERAPGRLGERLVKSLRKAGANPHTPIPKVARALGVRPFAPDFGSTADLGNDATTADFIRSVVGSSVRRLLAHDPVIRIGEDPEGVHQARVATRKLRSDLRTFRSVLEPGWCEELREELHWLGAALGRVRDADVLTELLQSKIECLPEDQRAYTDALLARLAGQREREREELLLVMRSTRYAALLDRLVDAARTPAVLRDAESRPARKVAHRLARKPWRRLCRSARVLRGEPVDTALHEVRRKAKQARYALEALTAVSKGRASRLAEHAAEIQQALGDHQDRVVARAWLFDTGRAADQPEIAFAAGELAALLSSEQRAQRSAARRKWRAACKQDT